MVVEEVLCDNPGEKKSNILFVGDMYETDVKGANNVGIKVAWINRKNEVDIEQIATYSISEIKELQGIICML